MAQLLRKLTKLTIYQKMTLFIKLRYIIKLGKMVKNTLWDVLITIHDPLYYYYNSKLSLFIFFPFIYLKFSICNCFMKNLYIFCGITLDTKVDFFTVAFSFLFALYFSFSKIFLMHYIILFLYLFNTNQQIIQSYYSLRLNE